MAVEINSLSSSNLKGTGDSGLVTTRSGLPGGKRSATSTTSTRKDSFDMTGSAGKLLELEARIAAMPIVDAQKVEAVLKRSPPAASPSILRLQRIRCWRWSWHCPNSHELFI